MLDEIDKIGADWRGDPSSPLAGVRNLDREIAAVARKVARRLAEGQREPVQITADSVVAYLGQPRVLRRGGRADYPPEYRDGFGMDADRWGCLVRGDHHDEQATLVTRLDSLGVHRSWQWQLHPERAVADADRMAAPFDDQHILEELHLGIVLRHRPHPPPIIWFSP